MLKKKKKKQGDWGDLDGCLLQTSNINIPQIVGNLEEGKNSIYIKKINYPFALIMLIYIYFIFKKIGI